MRKMHKRALKCIKYKRICCALVLLRFLASLCSLMHRKKSVVRLQHLRIKNRKKNLWLRLTCQAETGTRSACQGDSFNY